MSFCCVNDCDEICLPGAIADGQALTGLCERVCVEVFKVYDAGVVQKHMKGKIVELSEITPHNARPPYVFTSCKAASNVGTLRNVRVIPMPGREQYSRVVCDCIIPVEIGFTDSGGCKCRGYGTIFVPVDIVLAVPPRSAHIAVEFKAIVGAIAPTGEWIGENSFSMELCVNIIMKCGAHVDILLPSYGFCGTPRAVNYNDNIRSGFFDQPMHPH